MNRWLDGEAASVDVLAESPEVAVRLAEFLTALQRFAPDEIPALSARDDLIAGLRLPG